MTVICGGGPSGPKSGTPEAVALAGTALELLITRRLPWIAPFISFLSPFVFDADSFCTVDPEPMPTWTATDVAQLLYGGSSDLLLQTVRHVAWYAFCQCNAPTTTPVPPAVPPPVNLPVVQANPLGACDTAVYTPIPIPPVTGNLWPFQGTLNLGNTLSGLRPFPVGRTHFEITVTRDSPLADQETYRTAIYGSTAEGGAAQTIVFDQSQWGAHNGNRKTFTGVIPDGLIGWVGEIRNIGGVESTSLQFTIQTAVHCGGPPTSLQPACCPPDPTLSAKLDQLMELVTEIQRQGVPFAYVPGLTYPGLSGIGEISFSDPIIRLKVDLTTLPVHYGMAEGEPDRFFEIGWIAIGTEDGYEKPRPITNTPFLLPVRGDITRIGYSFNVGIVATIETFSREP